MNDYNLMSLVLHVLESLELISAALSGLFLLQRGDLILELVLLVGLLSDWEELLSSEDVLILS